jgi:DNA-binding beta-propeller fold protein YncE
MVGKLYGYLDAPVFWRVPLESTPRSLAVGKNGLVYVVTADGRLHTFDVDGNQLPALSLPSGTKPSHVVADPFGSLVIIDDEQGRFFVLSTEGKLLASGGQDIFGPAAVSPEDGNLYLLMGSAIHIYTIDTGDFVRIMPLDDLHSYAGLAIDKLGALYTVRDYDWDPTWVQLTSSTGEEMNAMPLKTSNMVDNAASDVAIDASGNCYVLFIGNTGNIAVHKLDPNGYFLNRFGKLDYDSDPTPEGLLFEPRAIAVSPDGRYIFITDGYEEKSHLTAFLLEPEQ